MTWNPIFPAWMLVLVMLALVGLCVWGLLRTTSRGTRIDWVLRAVVAVLIGIACLRPGIGTQSAQTQVNDVDVLFVIDTTASMNAEDWGAMGTRLEGAKRDIADLAIAHAGARFSVITFDANAVQRLPFTTDASALQSSIDTIRPEITLYSRGSSISVANTLVGHVMEDAAEQYPERARLIYYLGDGEQTSSKSPESFAKAATNIHGGAVLGYGTDAGGPMLETLSGFTDGVAEYITTTSGETAISRIDEANLTAIASDLGVGYQLRSPDSGVEAVEVDASKLTTSGGSDVETAFDLYWIFAIAAFAILLREVWVGVRNVAELRYARGTST